MAKEVVGFKKPHIKPGFLMSPQKSSTQEPDRTRQYDGKSGIVDWRVLSTAVKRRRGNDPCLLWLHKGTIRIPALDKAKQGNEMATSSLHCESVMTQVCPLSVYITISIEPPKRKVARVMHSRNLTIYISLSSDHILTRTNKHNRHFKCYGTCFQRPWRSRPVNSASVPNFIDV